MRTAIATIVFTATVAAAAEQPTQDVAPPAKPGLFADHRIVDAEIPLPVLDRARTVAVLYSHAPADKNLTKGLEELAAAEPQRYTLRTAYTPMRDWLRIAGGFAHFQVGGGTRPESRLADFERLMGNNRIGDLAAVAAVQYDTRDLPSGRQIESGYYEYSGIMEINVSSVSLAGVYVEQLSAYRTVGNGTTGVVDGPFPYPVELPNVNVRNVRTNVKVPMGISGENSGIAPVAATPWPRDPRVAWPTYRDGMEKLAAAHPTTRFVWTTIPLASAGNTQRSYFNAELRAYAHSTGKLVFDLADIASHDPAGTLQTDRDGQVLASMYAEPGVSGAMNATGRQRAARAWWWLMARIGGWEPPAGAVSTAADSTERE
ncbi:MAG: hypothetical protein H0V44_15780 [Planctomycetes bacterium]|nr:hypothetical protein [Planctomycetota bacterium]